MDSAAVRAARTRGDARSDWERVRRAAQVGLEPAARDRAIGIRAERKRGRPVQGEPQAAISLRLPESVLARWKTTGPGGQTRMAEALAQALPA